MTLILVRMHAKYMITNLSNEQLIKPLTCSSKNPEVAITRRFQVYVMSCAVQTGKELYETLMPDFRVLWSTTGIEKQQSGPCTTARLTTFFRFTGGNGIQRLSPNRGELCIMGFK